MKNIVIIGAGPVGMYTAALLLKRKTEYGNDISITVIDPHIGTFTRQRVVAKNGMYSMNKSIEQEINLSNEGLPDEAMYLKDFEQQLYYYCKKNGVSFKKGKAIDIKGDDVVYKIKSEEEIAISSELVIDCSGTRRALLNQLNSQEQVTAFTITELGNNPIKTHLSNYLLLTKEESSKLQSTNSPNYRQKAMQLINLRNEFGWAHFSFPTLDIRKGINKDGMFKYYIYIESPDYFSYDTSNILKNDYFINVLKLYYDFDDLEYEIISQDVFLVNPHIVQELYYQKDENSPVIIPGGDCQMEPDYRIGIGILSGIERANALFNSLTSTKNNGIDIDYSYYHSNFSRYSSYHIAQMESHYQERNKQINETHLISTKELFMEIEFVHLNEKIVINEILALAEKIKILGNLEIKRGKNEKAESLYAHSLNLLQLIINPQEDTVNSLSRVQSNMCLALFKQEKYIQCIKQANEAINSYIKLKGSNKVIFQKILFRKAIAIISHVKARYDHLNIDDIEEFEDQLDYVYKLMNNNELCGLKNELLVKIENEIHKFKDEYNLNSESNLKINN